MSASNIIEYSLSKTFSTALRTAFAIITVICFIGGFIPFIEGPGLNPLTLFSVLFLILFVMENRAQIDPVRKMYRTVNYFFGIRLGKWEPMPDFTDISMVRRRLGQIVHDYGSLMSTRTVSVSYDVILLNENHRVKWSVARFKSEKEARAARNRIAEEMKLNIAKYAPVLQSPRARRSRRPHRP